MERCRGVVDKSRKREGGGGSLTLVRGPVSVSFLTRPREGCDSVPVDLTDMKEVLTGIEVPPCCNLSFNFVVTSTSLWWLLCF